MRGRDTRAGEGAVDDIEFVIVRPSDAPAFVGCGGADCGICGWDSLIEADFNLLQLVDLGYGLCTFIEAEPAWRAGQAERNYARRGSLRVATKYPRIASAWYAERGVNADIVSLHGNIELGPIVGMTDRIVDITATGATLRDNDLVITGRTLFGAAPCKGQELEEHYFGAIRPTVSAYMKDLDDELWALGIPAKTKHNEVAPCQHELAPIYDLSLIHISEPTRH